MDNDKIQYKESNSTYRKIYQILLPKDRIKFVLLMIMSVITAFVETAGVGSFMPFIYLLVEPSVIQSNNYLNAVYTFGHFQTELGFIKFVGISLAGLILLSNALILLNNWFKNRFVLYSSHNLAKRLLGMFLDKPYEFILQNNSSALANTVLSESGNFSQRYLLGLIDIIINTLIMLFMIALLVVVNVKVTSIALGFFISVYAILSLVTRAKLRRSGQAMLAANQAKYKAAFEALNSFKITKSLGLEKFFIDRFGRSSKTSIKHLTYSKIISDFPKQIMDAFVFCGAIGVILILISRGNNFNSFVPLMTVYAYAGNRMMPILSNIFKSLTNVIHNRPLLDKIYSDLFLEFPEENQSDDEGVKSADFGELAKLDLSFDKEVTFDHVTFKYIGSDTIIDDLMIEIKKHTIVGFAGTTGAGKTTLIDIFLGLLPPTNGFLTVDGQKIDQTNMRIWRRKIGYVPQDIFLIDDTVKANIAFGIPADQIDESKVRQVAQIASIADFIEREMPEGYDTVIGERGVRLSGGQRQRIGLARALYRDPEILVLDEATSALDGATEESVLQGIHNDSKVSTMLIIAHRLDTLRVCDQIYILEKGHVIGSGNYKELIDHNDTFRKMAKLSSNQ